MGTRDISSDKNCIRSAAVAWEGKFAFYCYILETAAIFNTFIIFQNVRVLGWRNKKVPQTWNTSSLTWTLTSTHALWWLTPKINPRVMKWLWLGSAIPYSLLDLAFEVLERNGKVCIAIDITSMWGGSCVQHCWSQWLLKHPFISYRGCKNEQK